MSAEHPTKGERTRSEIIQAAHGFFVRQGYHGTSMRQIARQAGIALGGIYNHFASKEDIFTAVLEAYHPYHDILPALETARGETVEAFVRDAATSLITALDKRPDFLNLMFIEIVEFKNRHIPELFKTFFPQVMELVQRFAEKQGNLRPIPLPMIIRVFIGLFFSYYMTGLILGEHYPPAMQENALECFVDIYLHGILSESNPVHT